MDAVGLVELGILRHAVEEEGIERHAMLVGQPLVEGVELLGILGPEIARRQHAGQPHGHAGGLQLGDDGVEIAFGGGGVERTQRIVGAQFDHHDVGLVGQHPVDPFQASRGGVARDAVIDDSDVAALLLEGGFEPGRYRLRGADAITGREAVAQNGELYGRGLCMGNGGAQDRDQQRIDRCRKTTISNTDSHRFSSGACLTDPIVRLSDVHLDMASDAGTVNILRGVTLDIAVGEIAAVVGPSGAGKSSLMMVAGGLERATSGRVEVAGRDLGPLDDDARARLRRDHIGIVFQGFHLIPTMTAHENVALPLEFAGRNDAFELAEAALGRVGLSHRIGHYPAQLSGGEQQRVAVARAFVGRPKLLLADEPTGNLDGTTGKQVMDLLFELARADGTTLILITHDMALAGRCDRILRIADGLVVADERTAAALAAQ